MSSMILGVGRTTFYSWVVAACLFVGWSPRVPFEDVPTVQSGRFVEAELADWLNGVSDGVYVEGSELRLQEGRTAGTYESRPYQTPFGVNAALLQWHADVAADQVLTVDFRWSVDGQAWSDWLMARGRADGAGGAISQLFVLPPTTSWLQYQVHFEAGAATPTLSDTTVTYLNTTMGGDTPGIATRTIPYGPPALTAAPATIPNAASGVQEVTGDIVRQRPQRVVLSSIPSPTNDTNSASTLRAIQWMSTNIEQHTALPYHFVLDGSGTIFQGSGSATAVIPDVQEGTVAVAVMADVEVDGLGDTLSESLPRLLGWIVDAYGLSLNAIEVAPDAPTRLRDALPGLRDATDRSIVRSRSYFAAGNTSFGPERLVLFNPGGDEARATVNVLSPLGPEQPTVVIPTGQRVEVPLNSTVPINGPLGIEVMADRPLESERIQDNGREIGGGRPPGPGERLWYFAEGSSADDDVTTLDLLNPLERDVSAVLTLIPDEGEPVQRELMFGARSQQSVQLNDVLPGQRFAIKLVAAEPVVAERTTTTATGAMSITPGSATLERRWFFAEGSTLAGYQTTLALYNPWLQQIGVRLRVLSEDGTSLDRQYTIDGQSRRSVPLNDIAPDLPFAMVVEAERPIAAERIITFDEGRGLTITPGATRPATQWTFAEGSTAYPSEEYLLVVNPDSDPVSIDVGYVLTDGRTEHRTHEVGAGARLTISVNADVPEQPAVSAIVTAEHPVVVERTMYVNTFEGRGGETSLGVAGD